MSTAEDSGVNSSGRSPMLRLLMCKEISSTKSSTAEGEPLLELLPKLEEVRYSGWLDSLNRDAVTAFVDARRRVTGHLLSMKMVKRFVFPDGSDSGVNSCTACTGERCRHGPNTSGTQCTSH
jgi:hypothetical protein